MHQFSHLHVAQMRYALGQLTVVVKQIPLTFYFNNRVVVSPAQNRLQNNTTVGEGPVRVVASGVGNKVRVASGVGEVDRKSTRLNSSHVAISYAVFCLKKKRD